MRVPARHRSMERDEGGRGKHPDGWVSTVDVGRAGRPDSSGPHSREDR